MTPLPFEGALVLAEEPLAIEELGRMQDAPLTAAARGVEREVRGARAHPAAGGGDHVVQHLVVDDERHEVPGHPRSIERGVDADEALEVRVAPELDGLARTFAAARLLVPPRDEGVAGAAEVLRVDVLEEP